METATEIKPSIWKAKKLYWYDRETIEAERGIGYPQFAQSMVRMMIVNGLRDDNTTWYAASEIRGSIGDSDIKTKLERAHQTMDMASHYNDDPSDPTTEEEWTTMVENDRLKNSGTYFDETSIPTAIGSGSASVPSI